MKLVSTTSERIKNLRAQLGLSMRDFALKIGTTGTSIFRWENGVVGKLTSEDIINISEAFDVNPLWVMGYDVVQQKPDESGSKMDKILIDKIKAMSNTKKAKLIRFIEDFM